jgi:glucose uptake protein GlcU
MAEAVMIIWEQLGRVWGVAPLALGAGIVYALIVDYLERNGHSEGYAWLEVVVGVAFTLAIGALVYGPEQFIGNIVFFAFTGLPMIITAAGRYFSARDYLKKAKHGNKKKTVAQRGQGSKR